LLRGNRVSVRLAFDRLPAAAPRRSGARLRTAARRLVATLGRQILKYVVLRAPSMRSPHFGGEEMADLAVRFLRTNEIRGSYLEFGVFRGAAFAQYYHALRRHRLDLPMFGFDSFQGLPTARGADADAGFRRYDEGYFACTESEARSELRRRRVPETAYTLVPGFYQNSLQPTLYDRPGLIPSALVLIDCFYYESTRLALRFITPTLQNGTVLMCNSYFRFKAHPDHGERGAVAEWSRQNPTVALTEYAKFGTTGVAYVVHLAAPATAEPRTP
jgi:macrocin-O-methyltransferase TylF-like protien